MTFEEEKGKQFLYVLYETKPEFVKSKNIEILKVYLHSKYWYFLSDEKPIKLEFDPIKTEPKATKPKPVLVYSKMNNNEYPAKKVVEIPNNENVSSKDKVGKYIVKAADEIENLNKNVNSLMEETTKHLTALKINLMKVQQKNWENEAEKSSLIAKIEKKSKTLRKKLVMLRKYKCNKKLRNLTTDTFDTILAAHSAIKPFKTELKLSKPSKSEMKTTRCPNKFLKITKNVAFEFFNFLHFSPIFVQFKLTCLVTLIALELQRYFSTISISNFEV